MKAQFIFQVALLLLACIFAAILNSHPKHDHTSQIIGAIGLVLSLVGFVSLTVFRIYLAAKQRSRLGSDRRISAGSNSIIDS
jgi:uncharacterized membrane protein